MRRAVLCGLWALMNVSCHSEAPLRAKAGGRSESSTVQVLQPAESQGSANEPNPAARLNRRVAELPRFEPAAGEAAQAATGTVPVELSTWKVEVEKGLSGVERLAAQLLEPGKERWGGEALLALSQANLFFAEESLRALRLLSPRLELWSLSEKARLGSAELKVAASHFQRSLAAAQLCVEWDDSREGETKLSESCGSLAKRAVLGATYGREPALEPQAAMSEQRFEEDCAFRGAGQGFDVVLQRQGVPLARLREAEIEELAFAQSSAGAMKLRTSRPFVGDFVLAKGSRILRLKKRHPLFGEQVVLPSGALVEVEREPSGLRLSTNWPGGAPSRDRLILPCDALSLDGSQSLAFTPSSTALRMVQAEKLYKTPEGEPLTLVGGALAGVEVEAKKGRWLLVRSEENPFLSFRGWMHEPTLVAPEGRVRLHTAAYLPANQQLLDTVVATSGGQLLRVAAGTKARSIWAYGSAVLIALQGASSLDGLGFWIDSHKLRPLESR